MRESMDKNRIQGVSVGRAGNLPRSPYPSSTRIVDPATVRRRRLNLPREICSVSLRRLRLPRGILTAAQKSAEGILGHDVGKANQSGVPPALPGRQSNFENSGSISPAVALVLSKLIVERASCFCSCFCFSPVAVRPL